MELPTLSNYKETGSGANIANCIYLQMYLFSCFFKLNFPLVDSRGVRDDGKSGGCVKERGLSTEFLENL